MKSRELEHLARGPDPRSRVDVPKVGGRCPRHHDTVERGQYAKPCLLCRPDLVPVEHGGTKSPVTARPSAPP